MERSKTQKHVDEVMDYFDFSKVQRTMSFLNWEMLTDEGLKIPDESNLRSFAREQIYSLIDTVENGPEDIYYSHCGPFKVRVVKEGNEICSISLDFVVTTWEAYDYEDD